MSYKKIKDFTNLIASCRMWANGRKHYWDVYLWKNKEAMLLNTKDLTPECGGAHCPLPTLMDPESGELIPLPKAGEVHFINKDLSLEHVAHELSHAMIHRLKILCPSYKKIIEEDDMEAEEIICYEFGKWIYEIYIWLSRERETT